MAAVSFGLILAGVFVTDSGTKIVSRHGLGHVLASIVVFGGLMLACLAFAWRLRSQGAFAAYSLATGLFIPIGIAVTTAAGRWTGIA